MGVSAVIRARGFALVELMIAMLLGLFVAATAFALFATMSRVNATQAGLARLQENGRVAVDLIAADLRSAGGMPCGATASPLVHADALAEHLADASASASAPADARSGQPYALDRGVFVAGSDCPGDSCSADGVPRTGLAVGRRVPGTDVLRVRWLQDNGVPVVQTCDVDGRLVSLAAAQGAVLPEGFRQAHVALLAGCMRSQVFAVEWQGGGLQVLAGGFGMPVCTNDATARLHDLDAQMQTAIWYVQVVQDEADPRRRIAALMRRVNGTVGEVAQGVERFDLRYSLTDAAGNAHWLRAGQMASGAGADGAALACGMADAPHACGFGDANAVEISLLVNDVEDLPADAAPDAFAYRYSFDDANVRRPGATMPVTGLPAGRMLRREFRTVVALRGFAS